MNKDSRLLRNALGKFATGVCVITASPRGENPFGLTINSFASLSLEPPLVLWSLAKSSDTFAIFENLDSYVVNVLSENQKAISAKYSRRSEHDLNAEDFHLSDLGSPVISDSLVVIECEITDRHDGGDHTVLVGRVIDFHTMAEGNPLVFFAGQYQALKELV